MKSKKNRRRKQKKQSRELSRILGRHTSARYGNKFYRPENEVKDGLKIIEVKTKGVPKEGQTDG